MQPVKPQPRDGFQSVEIAKDQPQYARLPANIDTKAISTTVETAWKFTLLDRIKVLFGAPLYRYDWTFGKPFSPTNMRVGRPTQV